MFALILVFVTWLMAIYLLLSKEKKKLSLWKMKRNKALYHKIEMDKFGGGNGGAGPDGDTNGSDGVANDGRPQHNEQHGFTIEDDDKYDAISVKEIRRDYKREMDDEEGYELRAKLIGNHRQRQQHKRSSSEASASGRKESGFSIKSPNRNR